VVAPGASVGGHLIEAVLGSGGVGTVCIARQPDSDYRVALKVLNTAVSGDPVYRRRFAEEVRATRSLHHPNIVRVYGHGETSDGILWMAMQYVRGTDADRELRAGRMPPRRAAHIITEVSAALDYAHAHALVHGDVKPPNFLLGPDSTVVLADFGLARSTGQIAAAGGTGFVLTSAAYAAPELLRGHAVDARADVYALGCSLFRLLTGKPPFFDAASKAAVVDAQLRRAAPPVTRYAPWLPAQLDDVVATAMAKEPSARYSSAGQLARAAGAALDREQPC